MNPNKITTLALNPSWQPHGWYSAGDTMRLLMKNAVRGFDADGSLAGWEPCKAGGYPLSWRDRTVRPYTDAPRLHSGGCHEVIEWKLPTITLIRPQASHLDVNTKHVSPNSVKGVWELYKHTCAFCEKIIPLEDATRDHWFPTSKGGENDIYNMVLACKKCNNKKGDTFPFFNKYGVEPKIRIPLRGGVNLPSNLTMREEWKQFCYIG
tara:strand:- start:2586 stop:3209 length:624 start_codon:yes stop_codon:yes gene_type:complete